jgi:NhaP-type Na+/H+ or K+/H+ antiporter
VLLLYSVTLLAAVLLSERFNRTVLSSAVLFLGVGFLVGPRGAALVSLEARGTMVHRLSDWALVTILFSDALRLGWPVLRKTWKLPGRALFFGLPLTLLGIALAGRWLLDLRWTEALLVGAILSPTDPVFASAIVGREEIPARLRHLLNVESGLNDGLALPLVIVLMGVTAGTPTDAGVLFREGAGGVLFGAAIGAAAARLRRLRIFGIAESAAPLLALSAMLITYSGAEVLHLNPYLASFTAG